MNNLDFQRRYARQIMLPEIGKTGQHALHEASVLVIGAGGLGAAVLSYLAAAGVGHIGIIDHDRVELSNLNRQIIHETADIGRLKVESARDRMGEIAPECDVQIYPYALDETNANSLVKNYDIIADGCDKFSTRFMVNAACIAQNKPLVSAAIAGWNGQVASFHSAHGTACYACMVHPDAPEANTCRESGIIGPLAGVVGSMQALEVARMILGMPALLGKLAVFDGKTNQQRVVEISRDEECAACHR